MLESGFKKRTLRLWFDGEQGGGDGAGAEALYGDGVRVAAEVGDLVAHPLQRLDLVPDACSECLPIKESMKLN